MSQEHGNGQHRIGELGNNRIGRADMTAGSALRPVISGSNQGVYGELKTGTVIQISVGQD